MDEKMTNNKQDKKVRGLSFGKIMLASAVGTLIVMILIGLFKLVVLLGIVGSSSSETEPIAAESFLKIDLTESIPERTPGDLEAILSQTESTGFSDILRGLDAAATDNKIKGIYLYLGSTYTLSWGKSEELREALLAFRKSGKPVLAYADGYSQQGYYLVSAADSIYLNPSGLVEFRGIGAEAMFFKEMLDRLDVKITLIRPKNNSFKSAGETYTMNHMSDANREQIRQYIKSIWGHVTEKISETRNISVERLNVLADSLSACLPEDALQNGLVDKLCFESDISTTIKEVYKGKKIVEISKYHPTIKNNINVKERIAIIYAEGDVNIGTGTGTGVYSDKIAKALNDAANDDNIKAIVLRVNSPGGMVTASEIMTHAVANARAKKPVIVSMSDVAASAGYEISCNATCIVAEPTTITGSIGVFATLPELGGTLRRYLGITTDTAKTNTNSTALSIMRPISPRALELMQRNVEDFYTVFIGRVAKGRGLDVDFVDSIARGRVWTGLDALELGLVDTLGGLETAIAIAAREANIKTYRVVDYPIKETLWEQIMNMRKNSSGTLAMTSENIPTRPTIQPSTPLMGDGVWIGGNAVIETLTRICETQGLQARVEFILITE